MKAKITQVKKNIFYSIICLVCIIILILILSRTNLVKTKGMEKYQDYNEDNLKNTNIYVLYIPNREKYIKDIMKKLKLEPKFIQGPDKNKLDLKIMIENNEIEKNFGIERNRGQIACHLGHLKILNNLLQSNKKYALIFEDDIYLSKDKNEQNDIGNKIKNLINNIPPDADIVYFGYCFENCSNEYKYNEYFNKSINPSCRHSYLVSKKGANIIINNTTKYVIE